MNVRMRTVVLDCVCLCVVWLLQSGHVSADWTADGWSSMGGGAASSLFLQSSPAGSSSIDLSPLLPHSLTDACQRHLRKERRNRKSLLHFSQYYQGSYRLGQLFCRTGFHLQMHPNGQVNGTRRDDSPHGVLEFISVAFGLVSIRGKSSKRYLCMSKKGKLQARLHYRAQECIFMERMLENYYNTYSSCAYPPPKLLPNGKVKKRRWYISISRKGRPRRGRRTRKKKKITHFLVLHLDDDDYSRTQYAVYHQRPASQLAEHAFDNMLSLQHDNTRFSAAGKFSDQSLASVDHIWSSLITDQPINNATTELRLADQPYTSRQRPAQRTPSSSALEWRRRRLKKQYHKSPRLQLHNNRRTPP